MKITFVFLFLFFFYAEIRESSVPEIIVENFYKKFSNAKNVKWKKEFKSYYASFVENGDFYYVYFQKDGKHILTEIHILLNHIPEKIKNFFNSYRVLFIIKYESEEDEFYYIKAEKAGKTYEFYFNKNFEMEKVSMAEDKSISSILGILMFGLIYFLLKL